MNRKERVLSYLQQNTERFAAGGFSSLEGFETEEIARALGLDRANVSKLLNELWNAGSVMKVQGRPTLYLSLRMLEAALPGQFVPITLAAVSDLMELCREGAPAPADTAVPLSERSFTDSLMPLTQEAISVCSYPPYGLPLLLVSPSQKDAEAVAGQVYERVKERRGPEARMLTVDCRGSVQGDKAILHRIFGCGKEVSPSGKAVRSSFETAAHGLVFLVGVHRLPDYILELVLTAIDRQTYCRIGETVSRPLDVTLILTLPPQGNEALLTRLNKHVPCLLNIPALDSRSMDEKLLLLLRLWGEEAAALGRSLRLDKDVLAYLLTARYPAGISEMHSVVRLLCSQALRQAPSDRKEYLAVSCNALPQRVVTDAEGQMDRLHHTFRLLDLVPNDYLFFPPDGSNEVLRSFHQLWLRSGSLEALPDGEIFAPTAQQLADPEGYLDQLLDHLRRFDSERVSRMGKAIPYYILQSASRLLAQSPAGEPLKGEPVLRLGLLMLMHLLALREIHLPLPEEGLSAPDSGSAVLCQNLFSLFGVHTGFVLSRQEIAFFAEYLALAGRRSRQQRTALLILCHGKGIASEYASMLETYGPPGLTVAAVDVSVGETLGEVTNRAAEAVRVLDRGAGVALIADMAPLLSLAPVISKRTGVPCRGVGEVSLSALMDLSEQCVAGRELSKLTCTAPAGEEPALPMDQQDPFMHRYLYEVFAPNLTFLDLKKAAGTLSVALSGILGDLEIPYSRDVAIKFLSHSSYMLERVITGHTMSFPNLRKFLADQQSMILTVSRRLEPVGNTFGVVIPAPEIAYITEIFLEYK